MKDIRALIDDMLPEIVDLRHAIHQNPELGYEEHRTAARIIDQIEKIPDLDMRTGVGGTGIIATLGKEKEGPCVALRADMDALPMDELSDLPYKSQTPGKMHACGHDGHVSCLVGAARVLAQCTEDLDGPVKFIFQPAEEGGLGGKRMCEEGALKAPDVTAIFGLHGWPQMAQGQIGIRSGGLLASADKFEIDIEGTGSHAAFPHQGVDPVLIASHIVVALQSIASRNTDPLESVVVTVAQIDAGTAFNIIPQTAKLKGTVRALTPDVRAHTLERILHIATHIAEGFGGQAEVHIDPDGFPVTYNDVHATQLVQTIAQEALSNDVQLFDVPPTMGSEDFAFYAEHVPAAFFFLGVRPKNEDTYPGVHQPDFNFADGAIPFGIKMHVEIARNFARVWNA